MGTTAERLLAAATSLFAARGYDGTSVRAIAKAADANLNAVSYHFGGKPGLYAAVIERVGDQRLEAAERILGDGPRDRSDLETRLLLFAQETLAAWLEEPGLLTILLAELQQGFRHGGPEAYERLSQHSHRLVAFLERARASGLLRDDVDVDIVAGAVLERLNSQVLYADVVHTSYGTSIKDPAYRERWIQQTVGSMLYGVVPRAPDP